MKNSQFQTYWTIMPADCNYMFPLVFGGAFFAQLDLAAASLVRQVLYLSPCDQAVTYLFNKGVFHGPSYSGDTIRLFAEILELRNNSITVKVNAYRTPHPTEGVCKQGYPKEEHVAEVEIVFVTKKGGKFKQHHLGLTKNGVITLLDSSGF